MKKFKKFAIKPKQQEKTVGKGRRGGLIPINGGDSGTPPGVDIVLKRIR